MAELAAVLLGQRLGFTPDHIDNHAAYIGSWLRVLRGDKRFVFRAAADAQRAVDFLVDAAAKGAATRGKDGGVDALGHVTDTSAAEGAGVRHETA